MLAAASAGTVLAEVPACWCASMRLNSASSAASRSRSMSTLTSARSSSGSLSARAVRAAAFALLDPRPRAGLAEALAVAPDADAVPAGRPLDPGCEPGRSPRAAEPAPAALLTSPASLRIWRSCSDSQRSATLATRCLRSASFCSRRAGTPGRCNCRAATATSSSSSCAWPALPAAAPASAMSGSKPADCSSTLCSDTGLRKMGMGCYKQSSTAAHGKESSMACVCTQPALAVPRLTCV